MQNNWKIIAVSAIVFIVLGLMITIGNTPGSTPQVVEDKESSQVVEEQVEQTAPQIVDSGDPIDDVVITLSKENEGEAVVLVDATEDVSLTQNESAELSALMNSYDETAF